MSERTDRGPLPHWYVVDTDAVTDGDYAQGAVDGPFATTQEAQLARRVLELDPQTPYPSVRHLSSLTAVNLWKWIP